MLDGSFLSSFTVTERGNIATAVAGVFSGGSPLAGILPGTVSRGHGPAAGVVTWSLPLSGADAGTVNVALGWDATGPTATVGVADLKLGDGALGITASGGYAAGSVSVSAALGVHLENALAFLWFPRSR